MCPCERQKPCAVGSCFTEFINSVQTLIKDRLDPGIKFMRVSMCILNHLTPDWFTDTFGSADGVVFHAVFPQAGERVPLTAH